MSLKNDLKSSGESPVRTIGRSSLWPSIITEEPGKPNMSENTLAPSRVSILLCTRKSVFSTYRRDRGHVPG